ncbi:UDP-glucose 4-epimerase GalE [Pseudopedobacter beijingensis]|uniref:UDP-glucose 4-epimerase n=1 Tax=Pseudopedobacter beijingensis TaxID=1207056 RepID=A0ABW4IGL7_9SPHI
MDNNRILVTGGTGYIGSHTVVELQKKGYEVIIVDNLSNSDKSVLDRIEKISGVRPGFLEIDLADEKAVLDLVKNKLADVDKVIHFAAYKAVEESVREPLKYYRNNFYSLINLLTAFSGRKVKFVFSSSCTVYGEPDELPVSEQAPVKKATSPYGNTKQVAEEILEETAAAKDNYRIISLRYFNPVGAHSSAMIGELPKGVPQNLVPFITQSAIGKRGEITVFGNDYDTPDGSCIRDFIHVVDLAKAHVAAIERLEVATTKYEVFNAGTGTGFSVLQLLKAFEEATGVKPQYKIGGRRAGDIIKVWGNVSKAEQELNWKTELSIEEMMRSAWEWEKYIKENGIS